METLKKYCSPELVERLTAERRAYQSIGIFFDNKVRFAIFLIFLVAFSVQ